MSALPPKEDIGTLRTYRVSEKRTGTAPAEHCETEIGKHPDQGKDCHSECNGHGSIGLLMLQWTAGWQQELL
jgi:hypothetical protein